LVGANTGKVCHRKGKYDKNANKVRSGVNLFGRSKYDKNANKVRSGVVIVIVVVLVVVIVVLVVLVVIVICSCQGSSCSSNTWHQCNRLEK